MSSFRSCVSDGSLQAAAHCRVSSLAMASRLKKSLRAEERKRADVARARRRWIREQGWLDTTRLVFIDETAITTYMRATLSRSFFVISISSLPAFQEGLVQAQFCIDGTAGPFAWPRFRGQPPEPAGSRRKARGVDGESARRATMVAGHYAANVTAFLLILVPPFRLAVQRLDLDVSELHNGTVVLQADVALTPEVLEGGVELVLGAVGVLARLGPAVEVGGYDW